MTEPEFLDLEDVLLIHEEQLARYGGSAGVRDQGLLESAIGMPRATYGGRFVHEDLFAMAAAYVFHIAENQPFVDGNGSCCAPPLSRASLRELRTGWRATDAPCVRRRGHLRVDLGRQDHGRRPAREGER